MARRALAVMMGGAVRGQVAFVHALHAVAAGCAAVLVDALCFAFAAAHAGAASPQGGRANHASLGHDVCLARWCVPCCVALCCVCGPVPCGGLDRFWAGLGWAFGASVGPCFAEVERGARQRQDDAPLSERRQRVR